MVNRKCENQLHWCSVMDQSCLIKRQSEKTKTNKKTDQTKHFRQLITIQKADWYMIICSEENGLLTSPYCQFWQFCCWHNVLVLFQNPAWQAQTDTTVSLWISRAKYQLQLRSLSWPFCSNSPECRSAHMCTWFWHHGDAFSTTENTFFVHL